MKMLVNFGYSQEYLFEVADLMILERAIPVKKDGYGRDCPIYLDENKMTFEMVREDRLRFGEEDTKEKLKKDLEAANNMLSNAQSSKYTLQNENSELKKQIETLKQFCPHTEEEKDEQLV